MEKLRELKKVIAAVICVSAICMVLMWNWNLWLFRGNSVAGLPDMSIRFTPQEWGSLQSLIFERYGSAEFNYFGESVGVYISFYSRDELILNERMASIVTVGNRDFNGSVAWGLTTEGNLPRELRAVVRLGSGMSQSYFDFSNIGFDFESHVISTAGPDERNNIIERGQRRVLQRWQTGSTMRADRNDFHPEELRTSEHTAILYILFD